MGSKAQEPVAVIGAGLDLGAGRRGVDMGPSAIRYAGLQERIERLGRRCVDWGDVEVGLPEATEVGDPRARYLAAIHRSCARVAALVAAALGVAGDSFASDAWPTPSLERVALFGVRSLDAGERELIGKLNARVFTMSDLDRGGVERAMREALEFLSGARFLHVSLDLDAVDPMVAPGVGTPVRGGLSYREAHLALELVAESGLLDSLELVEVNPVLDRANETGELAVELAASALGARIL